MNKTSPKYARVFPSFCYWLPFFLRYVNPPRGRTHFSENGPRKSTNWGLLQCLVPLVWVQSPTPYLVRYTLQTVSSMSPEKKWSSTTIQPRYILDTIVSMVAVFSSGTYLTTISNGQSNKILQRPNQRRIIGLERDAGPAQVDATNMSHTVEVRFDDISPTSNFPEMLSHFGDYVAKIPFWGDVTWRHYNSYPKSSEAMWKYTITMLRDGLNLHSLETYVYIYNRYIIYIYR